MSRSPNKKSKIVVGSEADSTDGFTKRMLLSMVVDVSQLAETTKRLQVQVFTLAKAHGIAPPSQEDTE